MLTDLDIGMNDWMCRDLQWDSGYRPDRGKIMSAEQLEKIEKFHRYLDVDGDGIPWRTLPGVHPKGAYFTRGSGHNMYGAYTEDAKEYQAVVDRLRRKWETAKKLMPAPVVERAERNRIGIISVGSCDGAVREARDHLADAGISTNYMRLKAFPFGQAVQDFIDSHDRLYVVEQNRDAQLRSLLVLETRVEPEKLVSILHYDGLPIPASSIVDGISQNMAAGKAA
jgi:2-oxoglutarate ferredoxin oxidoreductase subunit alpha